MASKFHRPVYFNPLRRVSQSTGEASQIDAFNFHKRLPGYSASKLVPLEAVARDIGVGSVYIKYEGQRLGLPSFKILGASWGTFRAVAHKLNLPLDSDISTVKKAASSSSIKLLTATDGNHGRAVAYMGALFGIPAEIFVPRGLDSATIEFIKGEGAQVTEVDGSYDAAVEKAAEVAEKASDCILIQDTAFPGYEDLPTWIVEGYRTMMVEVDEQLGDRTATLVIVPVGVGSCAQSVVHHCNSGDRNTKVLTVEPDGAACLYKSMVRGDRKSLETTIPTIMTGLNCGTVSSLAWPILQDGVDGCTTVSDFETHEALLCLKAVGVSAGPCGAAGLAALRRLTTEDKARLGLDEQSLVVLICTEGSRDYPVPRNMSIDDPETLTQALVQINSANARTGGPGESEISQYVAAWLEHRNFETHWIEPTKGRPSVIGVARGSGGGKNLMFNGHTDTVTIASYEGNGLGGEIRDGKLYGRGSADMKSGLAAMLVAAARAKQDPLRGDIIIAAVADEEGMSIGTEQILEAGWRADAAVVCEPSLEELVTCHKGFAWFEVTIDGVAAHGSRFDLGVDAITRAGYFLVELHKHAQRLIEGKKHPILGPGSIHAAIIHGGEEQASYPAQCKITLERRSIAGETAEEMTAELRELLEEVGKSVPGFSYHLELTFLRSTFEIAGDHPLVSLVARKMKSVTGKDAVMRGEAFWTDSALLADAGIPCVMYGPSGEGLHSKEEWADVDSIRKVSSVLAEVAREFCA